MTHPRSHREETQELGFELGCDGLHSLATSSQAALASQEPADNMHPGSCKPDPG